MLSNDFVQISVIFAVALRVCAVTETEDEALRKIFDFLKRKYTLETQNNDVNDDVLDAPDIVTIPTGYNTEASGQEKKQIVLVEDITVQTLHIVPTDPTGADQSGEENLINVGVPVTVHNIPIPRAETSTPQYAERVEQKQIKLPEKPRFGPTSKPLQNEFHGLNRLPGCDFLLNILHEAPSLPIKNDIIDYFDKDSTIYAEGLVTDLKTVIKYSHDYDAVSLLATRKVTKLIFLERLRCPATKFDMFTVQQMLRELTKLVHDEDESMYDFLASMLVELPNMAYSGFDPNYLAHEMTKHVHGQLFNDTIDYLLGSSMQDVEDFSRWFYEALRKELPFLVTLGDKMMNTDLSRMVQDHIHGANIHCPSASDVSRRHLNAVWDMTNGLKEIETYQLCMQIRSYLEQFVSLPTRSDAGDVKSYDTVMKNICGYVRDYVQAILSREQEYQKMVGAKDAPALQQFFQHYLTEDELVVLAEVLERLHWISNYPVTDKPIPSENITGEVLPKTHVISNELQDIEFWNSYLETLTPEAFERMDLRAFKESIRRWLKQKQTRVDNYYKFKNQSAKGENNNGDEQSEEQSATSQSED